MLAVADSRGCSTSGLRPRRAILRSERTPRSSPWTTASPRTSPSRPRARTCCTPTARCGAAGAPSRCSWGGTRRGEPGPRSREGARGPGRPRPRWAGLAVALGGPVSGASSSDSWRRNRDIDFICQPQAESLARIYSPSVDLTDVRVSPGLETRWRSWCPPTLLDYGGCESFHSQIELMIASMIKDGVDVDALEADGMVHCYPLMDFLWGSDPGPFEAYFARVARFLRR
ncbi:unnamed protein product [Prorocentrum cordatum]|uniref:Alpha/beta hydrolase fold-3 domain-containing protein n=1 Tax=Prorocentrum cordatum TaxID=2364126 RepID=A0ABN9T2H5_9DINO|nr:unnamed protein product [Polarella glacialis]